MVLCGIFILPQGLAIPVFRTTTIAIDGKTVEVEVAETKEQKQRGLQQRSHLEERRGMLFIFDHPQPLSFWMKDCLIPLDILFFKEGTLVDYVDSAEPCHKPAYLCPNYTSDEPADMVVELKAGTRKKWGLNRNSQLTFPRRAK